jgi:hypothetical protein
MSKNNFIYYKEVEKILKNNMFFGLAAKRENNRITYTYHSVRYPNVLIKVLTLKLDPKKILSEKIVLGIKFNDTEINGWKEFVNEMANLNKNYKTKYGNIKKN